MDVQIERSTLAGVITLTLGGILLGVSIMIVDELFTIMSTMNSTVGGTTYYWPIIIPHLMTTNAASIWTAWEVAFSMIILSVILMLIGGVVIAITR